MDKWRNKEKSLVLREDTLLPPTRRIASVNSPPLLDKRMSKDWCIDDLFKKVSSILDAQNTSAWLGDLSEIQKKREKGMVAEFYSNCIIEISKNNSLCILHSFL